MSVQASFNDAGTGLTKTTAHGRTFGGDFYAHLSSGATNFYQATGLEVTSEVDSGASTLIRAPLSISDLGGAVHGSTVDVGKNNIWHIFTCSDWQLKSWHNFLLKKIC